MKTILVLGSLNIDLVQRVPRVPAPGETLMGQDLQIFVGGKGANQACAAALLGGRVRMAGCVGKDVFAARLVAELTKSGVDPELIRTADTASGSATILVLPSGENMIVVSPGANAEVSVEFALRAVDNLEPGDFLLCQLEIPLETVRQALHAAHNRGIVTILDPAPARELPKELFASVSILTPNQTEAATLLGDAKAPTSMIEAEACAHKLQARGANIVIVKMGDQGCLIAAPGLTSASRTFMVEVTDTTAAGDTFNGALAVALARGSGLTEAADFANAAAAMSVTRPGAINSIPSLSEVEHFLSTARRRN